MDSLGRQQRTPSGRGHKWTAATTDVDGSDGGRYGEAAAAVMNGGDRCGRQGAFMPVLSAPFAVVVTCLPTYVLMWLRQRAERSGVCIVCPCRRSVPSRYVLWLLPVGQKRPWGKDVATTDVGQTGQYGDTGRWVPSYSIEQSTYVLFPFVLCLLYLVADACYVCSCAHLYRTCMHVMCVSA